MHVVVIEDLNGHEHEGKIATGNAGEVLATKPLIALLPVEPQLVMRGALAGWAKRCYGEGWKYDPMKAARGCPLVLHVLEGFPVINWIARVECDPECGRVSGTLRIASDTAQAGAHAAGLMPEGSSIDLTKLGDPDEHGGWFVAGRARMIIQGEQMLALQLYGMLSGARVRWFAASQTR